MRKKTRQAAVDVVRPAKRRASKTVPERHVTTTGQSVTLPGWGALSDVSPRQRAGSSAKPFGSMTTARFAVWLFGAGIAATLYVGHVQATQATFERLYGIRKVNLQLQLERDRLKGELDHATGPTMIYPKAYELGLKEGFEYGPSLTLTLK
jgi:hypothetical protein